MAMFKVTCKWNGEPWEKDIETEDEGDCAEHIYLFGVLISKANITELDIKEIPQK
ncbi:hypothetical protein KZA80_07665 [Proteus terrae]|uniref:hypothetical protein n=1 Tax=Proteus terrae TaxID=1574161 RepID=UPI0021B431AC|nr:hypothetical protein [Proteus terrae]UXA35775.1 hypothetical protein KZA80_07665 [Proteus terrae]